MTNLDKFFFYVKKYQLKCPFLMGSLSKLNYGLVIPFWNKLLNHSPVTYTNMFELVFEILILKFLKRHGIFPFTVPK